MLDTIRHQSIFDWTKHRVPIHIIGMGAVGSRIGRHIIELGGEDLHIYDDDKVEGHNLSNQIYRYSDVCNTKVDSFLDWTLEKTGVGQGIVTEYNTRLPDVGMKKDHFSGVVFLVVDTIQGRKDIANEYLKDNPKVDRVIETRMGSTFGKIISFDPCDKDMYNQWYDSIPLDDEPEETTVCGGSISVGITAEFIASIAVQQMVNLITLVSGINKNIVQVNLQPLVISTSNFKSTTNE